MFPCLAQDKIRRGAPPGWELELVRLSMGREGPAMSNWQVGARGVGEGGDGGGVAGGEDVGV